MNKYVFMRGYLVNNPKIKIKNLYQKLVKNGYAVLFFNSNNKIQKDCYVNNDFISEFLENMDTLLMGEINYLQSFNASNIILLYPIKIYLEKNVAFDLRIFLREFQNEMIIATIEIVTNKNVLDLFEKRIITIETIEKYLEIFKTNNNINILSVFGFIEKLLGNYLTLSEPITRNFFIMDKRKMN